MTVWLAGGKWISTRVRDVPHSVNTEPTQSFSKLLFVAFVECWLLESKSSNCSSGCCTGLRAALSVSGSFWDAT